MNPAHVRAWMQVPEFSPAIGRFLADLSDLDARVDAAVYRRRVRVLSNRKRRGWR